MRFVISGGPRRLHCAAVSSSPASGQSSLSHLLTVCGEWSGGRAADAAVRRPMSSRTHRTSPVFSSRYSVPGGDKSGRVRSGARIITDNASSPALTRAASVLSRRQKERLRHSLQLSRSSRTNLHTKTDEQGRATTALPDNLELTSIERNEPFSARRSS
jgi:hypothetical protein